MRFEICRRSTDPVRHIACQREPEASLLGQRCRALFEWARNPYVLLITIYVFAPYFSSALVGDPVAGQALWGDLSGMSGVIIAILAPFLGAIEVERRHLRPGRSAR
ncbi:MAG: hypothetical protein QM674_19160 [Burkholderiaceae bacterium]